MCSKCFKLGGLFRGQRFSPAVLTQTGILLLYGPLQGTNFNKDWPWYNRTSSHVSTASSDCDDAVTHAAGTMPLRGGE